MKTLRIRTCAPILVLALVQYAARPLPAQEKAEPVRVSICFTLPKDGGKDVAVKDAVARIPGTRDVAVSQGTVTFTVIEEKMVMLAQVAKAVESAAGSEAKVDRECTRLVGNVEIDISGFSAAQAVAAEKALASMAEVGAVEKPGKGGHIEVVFRSPKGASLAAVESAVGAAITPSEGSGAPRKCDWRVQGLTWRGPEKASPKEEGSGGGG